MPGKTIRLTSDDQRWMEMTVRGTQATARIGGSEPFPFSFEHLGFVAFGMSYQAWGAGSHFVFRKSNDGFLVEFQGPKDRSPAICRLSEPDLQSILTELEARPSLEARVRML